MNWKYKEDFLKDLNKENEDPNNYYDLYDYKNWLEKEVERLRNLANGAEQSDSNCNIPLVSNSVYCDCDNPTEYTDANNKTYCKWCGKDFEQ